MDPIPEASHLAMEAVDEGSDLVSRKPPPGDLLLEAINREFVEESLRELDIVGDLLRPP